MEIESTVLKEELEIQHMEERSAQKSVNGGETIHCLNLLLVLEQSAEITRSCGLLLTHNMVFIQM